MKYGLETLDPKYPKVVLKAIRMDDTSEECIRKLEVVPT